MKIGIFDPYLDDIGGGERYMMTIAKCLSGENDVDVFWDNKKDLEKIEDRFSIDLSKINLVADIFSNKFSFIEKQKIARKYDLLIILSDGSIPLLFSKRTYLHMQQPISHRLTIKEKLKLKKISKIFCNSLYTKSFIENNYHKDCDLLYPPVSIFGNSKNKENIIFHVGRFRVVNVKSEDYKKQKFMIDTFKKMVDEGLKNWKLVMAVSLNDLNDEKFIDMKQTAKNYPIEFLINSNKNDLWKIGSKAKIYWHATGFGEDLTKNPQLAEHFGISTVESMGTGAVPVVINGGGQREIVTEGSDGFLWGTQKEFIEKTLKLINDPKLLKKMSTAAFERAKYFDESNFCKRVTELIK